MTEKDKRIYKTFASKCMTRIHLINKYITVRINDVYIHTDFVTYDDLEIKFFEKDSLIAAVFYSDMDSFEII